MELAFTKKAFKVGAKTSLAVILPQEVIVTLKIEEGSVLKFKVENTGEKIEKVKRNGKPEPSINQAQEEQ